MNVEPPPVTREEWRIEGMCVVARAAIRKQVNGARQRLGINSREYKDG